MINDLGNINNVIVGILLGVLGNYTDSTLPCSIQNYLGDLEKSWFLKHFLVTMILWTQIKLDRKGLPPWVIPFVNLAYAFATQLLAISFFNLAEAQDITMFYIALGVFFALTYMAKIKKIQEERNPRRNTNENVLPLLIELFIIFFMVILSVASIILLSILGYNYFLG